MGEDIEENGSVDSNYEPSSLPTLAQGSSADDLAVPTTPIGGSPALEAVDSFKYDASTIRAEFETYRHILPPPAELLQRQPSFVQLRSQMEEATEITALPLFLRYKFEGGIKPHHALCCLLLSDYEAFLSTSNDDDDHHHHHHRVQGWYARWIRIVSWGIWHAPLHVPADLIRDQFYRVAPVIPTQVVEAPFLRKLIRNRGLPIPNYFLDPEDPKQFPPHIALLVILQDGDDDKSSVGTIWYELAFSTFALTALILRIVLEVIGGAGAIWGGAEVVGLRTPETLEVWRWISVAVGILCLLRFITLQAPQREDEGDLLGPAGPWSLRWPVRLRAVCDHPFHYFVRALPPSLPSTPRRRRHSKKE